MLILATAFLWDGAPPPQTQPASNQCRRAGQSAAQLPKLFTDVFFVFFFFFFSRHRERQRIRDQSSKLDDAQSQALSPPPWRAGKIFHRSKMVDDGTEVLEPPHSSPAPDGQSNRHVDQRRGKPGNKRFENVKTGPARKKPLNRQVEIGGSRGRSSLAKMLEEATPKRSSRGKLRVNISDEDVKTF